MHNDETKEQVLILSKVSAVIEYFESPIELVDFQSEKIEAATVSSESSESFQDSAYTDDDFELDSKVSNNL